MPIRKRAVLTVAAVLATASAPALALDYQVHGSAAQGFVLSDGNNYFGDSTHGSFEYYEGALNGTIKPLSSLLLSAQVVARDAGATDDGKLRLDYAFADYGFLSGRDGNAGLRLGRVKNSYGLFNDARDVIFTRPGVLMPSVYDETLGARALLFSSDGVQPYGGMTVGDHYLSAVATYAPDQNLSGRQKESIAPSSPGDLKLRDFYLTRLQDEWAEAWTAALSYLHGDVRSDADPANSFDFDFRLYVLSFRYSAPTFSLTSEYALTDFSGSATFSGFTSNFTGKSDSIYLQGDYFLSPAWALRARWDSAFKDRNDRSGNSSTSTCATNFNTGITDPHNCFAHDFSVGANWQSGAHWGIWGEYHLIDGLSTASARDNTPPAPSDPHWSLFLLMAAYRF